MPQTAYDSILAEQRRYVAAFVVRCAQESRDNEKDARRAQNQLNWDYVHGNIDWSHKRPEDPRVHLHKLGVAAERMRAKFKQALMNYDKWLSVEREYEQPDAILPTFVAKSLLLKQLERAGAKTKISDALLVGSVESRMCLKISGKYVTKPRFVSQGNKSVRKDETVWQLDLPLLRFEQYHRDTLNADDPLYEVEEARVDRYRVLDLSSDEQSPDQPYRLEAVKQLGHFAEREQEEALKRSENAPEKTDRMKERIQLLLQNFCGTILAEDGSIYEWQKEDGSKVPLRNVICVVGNEKELLLDPQSNKRWSGKSPYICGDPLRSPGTGRKALLDAGVEANRAEDELFSLMLAGAIKSVHNITWFREDWIADKRVLTGGIKDGAQVKISANAPPNAVPMGTIKVGEVPQEAMAMQNILDRILAENVISNQIDLSGNLPGKQVRATELVQASTAISDVFDSMAGDIEDVFIEQLAEEAFLEIIQHLDELDQDEVRSCFLDQQQLADQFLALSPKQRFEQVFGVFKFRGKGLKGLIANQAKAQMLINLINTIAANPIMFTATETQISAARVVTEIAREMGIDIEKIQPDAQERALIEQKQMVREQAAAMAEVMGRETAGQSSGGSTRQGSQPNPGMAVGNGSGGF